MNKSMTEPGVRLDLRKELGVLIFPLLGAYHGRRSSEC